MYYEVRFPRSWKLNDTSLICYIQIIYSSEIPLYFNIISEHTDATFPSAIAGFCIHKLSGISVFTSSLLWNRRPLHTCFSRPNKWFVLSNKTYSRGRISDTRPLAVVSVGTSGPWLDRCPSNSWELYAHRHSVTWEKRFETSIARGWF
jgi:hypothetical protein